MFSNNPVVPKVSVIMPSYNQKNFLARSLESLHSQTLSEWELIIIDDGSTDGTYAAAETYLNDSRIRLVHLDQNHGMGAALNLGLSLANAAIIAYLPTDDVYFREHLSTLVESLDASPEAILAYSGLRHHYNRTEAGQIPGYPLQLVQVAHRMAAERWLERTELVTDDLSLMYWDRLRRFGSAVETGLVTCEWVDHPHQRHKILREPVGGINLYRQRFNVRHPLRFQTTVGNSMDEVEHYRGFRERPDTPAAADGLKILIVGELAYNPERILALEERGHRLYGLWMPEPYWYNYVGPLPFGHVTDLPRDDWLRAIREIKPDVIYSLLNWQTVPFVHAVLQETRDIPFVWHFKEGPFICLEKGSWDQLIEIYQNADAHIFCSPEMRDWFETVVPSAVHSHPSIILDGDLPKADWFDVQPSPRISGGDGEFHTVVPGRPIGLHPHTIDELAQNGIHLHFYGNFTHGQWQEWIEKTKRLAPNHIHLHAQVDQENWVQEFSQYDAGWLHFFESSNSGDLRRANWDDLNIPARTATLALAGLPLLQRSNPGHIVATQNLVRQNDLGLFFNDMADLRIQLENKDRLSQLRRSVWDHRHLFVFDSHTDTLVGFFRKVIAEKSTIPGMPLFQMQRPGSRDEPNVPSAQSPGTDHSD